ncbi:unnamed protein product [Trichogramma brassicae]|uniref:Peroxisomal ATPase PEX1 N-terminal C-lobe domain-containing protein n=1 Tax=Trichogramma brassicae TaxID=86971 RepID=A0A6H5ILH7_9HYME|nr:unnamed protein product [Trichogramma brassicae]
MRQQNYFQSIGNYFLYNYMLVYTLVMKKCNSPSELLAPISMQQQQQQQQQARVRGLALLPWRRRQRQRLSMDNNYDTSSRTFERERKFSATLSPTLREQSFIIGRLRLHRHVCSNRHTMQNERFEVQFVRVNTCFVYLPEHWLRKLSSRANSSLRLRHNERDYYLSWYARPSPDQSRLCLGATFARSLGIKEADEVFVTVSNEQPPALTSLLCAPASDNDREIVELQSEIIQMNLLDQVRVVAVDQPIVAWVSKFLSVKLVVKSMNPQFKYGRLEENTEIYIGEAAPAQSKTLKEGSNNQRDVLDVIRAENSSASFGEIRRVLPLNRKETAAILPPCRVYAHGGGGGVTLARLRKIGEDQHDAKSSKIKFNFRRSSGAAAKETIVEVHPLDENLDSSSYPEFPRHPCVYVGPDLMRSASLRLNAKVVLEELIVADRDDVSRCTSIELAACSSSSSSSNSSSNSNEAMVSERRFRDWLRRVAATQRGGRVLINSGSLVSLGDDVNEASLCSVKLKPDGCAYGFFDASDAETVQVLVRDGVDVDAYRPPGLERDEEEDATTTTEREESNGNVALE